MTMFNAFHAIAAARGDGLLPEFLRQGPPQATVVSIDDGRSEHDIARGLERTPAAAVDEAPKRIRALRPARA